MTRPPHTCSESIQAARAGLQSNGNLDNTGVYVGISYSEYAQLSAARASSVSTYTATGGSLSVAAGVLLCTQLHHAHDAFICLSYQLSLTHAPVKTPNAMHLVTVCAHRLT